MSRKDANRAFTLHLKPFTNEAPIVVHVYDDLGWDDAGRIRIYLEVRQSGKVIFPRGQLYGALHGTSDGIRAREHALAILEMKPGDTDAEYFDGYTPEQLAWATRYGDEISCIRQERYCDENGEVRR